MPSRFYQVGILRAVKFSVEFENLLRPRKSPCQSENMHCRLCPLFDEPDHLHGGNQQRYRFSQLHLGLRRLSVDRACLDHVLNRFYNFAAGMSIYQCTIGHAVVEIFLTVDCSELGAFGLRYKHGVGRVVSYWAVDTARYRSAGASVEQS